MAGRLVEPRWRRWTGHEGAAVAAALEARVAELRMRVQRRRERAGVPEAEPWRGALERLAREGTRLAEERTSGGDGA